MPSSAADISSPPGFHPGLIQTQGIIKRSRSLKVNKRDPTRTITLRRAYEREMRKRFNEFRKVLLQTVVENDVFNLEPETGLNLNVGGKIVSNVQPGTGYDWPSDPVGKLGAFNDWMNGAINGGILENPPGWPNNFVQDAYNKGLAAANSHLNAAGIPVEPGIGIGFNLPIESQTLQIIYARQYHLLKGVTDSMAAGISDELTRGLAEGRGLADIGKSLNGKVKGLGIVRAAMIARTEVIYTYNQAALDRYQSAGITGVTAQVEFATAGDSKVCKKCEGLDGNIYTIQQARGMIPVHPNCRCTWLPVFNKTKI